MASRFVVLDRLSASRDCEVARVQLVEGGVALLKRFPRGAPAEFRAEIEALRQVEATEVTHLLDAGVEPDGTAWLLREWIDGRSLRAALPLADANARARVVADVSAALGALHRVGLVHADLKPENVLLRGDGAARLSDFGLATFRDRWQGAARRPEVPPSEHAIAAAAGSAYYLPPERLLGWPLDARADFFSFGVLLYELLGGRLPIDPAAFYARFPREPFLALMPDDLAARGATPTQIALIARLTEVDPLRRPADVVELRAEFAAAALLPAGRAVRPLPQLPRDFFLAPRLAELNAHFASRTPARLLYIVRSEEEGAWCERAIAIAAALHGISRPPQELAVPNAGCVVAGPLDARLVQALAAPIAAGASGHVALWCRAEELPATLPSWLLRRDPPANAATHLARHLAGATTADDAVALSLQQLAEQLVAELGPDPAAIDATLAALVAAGRLAPAARGIAPPPLDADFRGLPRPAAAPLVLPEPCATLARAAELLDAPLSSEWLKELADRAAVPLPTVRALLDPHWLASAEGVRWPPGRLPPPTPEERRRAGELLLATHSPSALQPEVQLIAALAAARLELAARVLVDHLPALVHGRIHRRVATLEPLLASPHASAQVLQAAGELHFTAGRLARAGELFAAAGEHPTADAATQLQALKRAGDVSLLRGEYELARQSFASGLRHAASPRQRSPFVRGLADATLRSGDPAGALELLEPLLEGVSASAATDAVLIRERLELEPLRALALLRSGAIAAAEEALKRAIAATRPLGHPALLAVLLTNLSLAQWRGGRPLVAIETAREALKLQEERSQAHEVAALHQNLGTILRDLERFDESRHHFEAALELRQALGDERGIALAQAGLALLAVEQGLLARAAAGFAAARPALERLGQPRERLLCRLGDLKQRLRAGRWQGLTRALAALLQEAEAGRHADVAIETAQLLFERRLATRGNLAIERAAEAFAQLERLVGAAKEARAATALELRRAQLRRAVGDLEGAAAAMRAVGNRLDGSPLALDVRLEEIALHGPPAESARIDAAERAARLLSHRRGLVAALCFRQAWHSGRGDRHGAAATRKALEELLREAAGSDVPLALRRAALGMMAPRAVDVARAASGRTGNEDEMTAHVQLLRTFLSINKRLAGEADVARLLQYLVETALSLTGGERGFIVLEREGATRVEVGWSARGGELSAPEKELSSSFLKQCLDKGRTLVTSNAGLDPRFREQASVTALELRSIVCVPIRVDAAARAALYVDHPVREGAFGEREIELVEALADQAGIALKNFAARERIEALNRQLATRVEVQESEIVLQARQLDRALPEPRADRHWIGASPAFLAADRLLARYAQTDLSVLVRGESGTGKERAARRLHELSPRRDRPFVSESCSAVPETLLEAEFFGVRKGAFTGADADRPGLFELARGGTLFLDEIGEMPLTLQAKLLRALEERAVRPLGAREPVAVDLRLVTATHRDLRTLAREGKFREDLYFRIAAAELELPPLRQRSGDVAPLAQSFLAELNREHATRRRFTPAAERALAAYSWPGNVRQLRNEVQRTFAVAETDDLAWEAPSDGLAEERSGMRFPEPLPTLAELERFAIAAALARHGGDKEAAARAIGISRASIYDKVRRYGLAPGSGRPGPAGSPPA